MPAWSFHIKVANDIAKILELTIFDKNGKISGIRTLNSIKYGNREYCLKIKRENLSKIAKWINIRNEYICPKNNIKIKIDSTIQNGSYIITEKDIELTEDWLSNNYKNTQLEFPKNELFTEENIDKLFINAEEFILKKLNQHLL